MQHRLGKRKAEAEPPGDSTSHPLSHCNKEREEMTGVGQAAETQAMWVMQPQGKGLGVLKRLSLELPWDPAMPLPCSTYPKE